MEANDRENCFRWRKVFKFLQTLLSDSNLINQIKLISYSSLAADSDKTFQLRAITSSVAYVRAFDELCPVPCGQQSHFELSSLIYFIQFHLPHLEFKNHCKSPYARNLLFITPELDLAHRMEGFKALSAIKASKFNCPFFI